MTMIEKAIAYLEELSCKSTTTAEGVHFSSMAIRALEKQNPMLVNHERTFWRYSHYCPRCSELLPREGLIHCDHCGQALDWSNYWEELKHGKRTHR